MRIAALATLAFAVAACSGAFGTMDGIMRSWEGAPLDVVIAQWGYPDQEQTIAGHRIYRWYYNKGFVTATAGPVGAVASYNCTRILEVNAQNIVTRWQWQGNNCPFAEALEYAGWRRK
jgi:hypothetical protein